MLAAGVGVTSRGQAWSDNCRQWVYFDCFMDLEAVRDRIALAPCVRDHEHLGTHDGSEAGFFCEQCKDGIMGVHPEGRKPSTRVYK